MEGKGKTGRATVWIPTFTLEFASTVHLDIINVLLVMFCRLSATFTIINCCCSNTNSGDHLGLKL